MKNRPLALVTGASRGIGAATARYLAEKGWDVAINYRNKLARAEEVAAAVTEAGGHPLLVQADLTRNRDRKQLADQLAATGRSLQLLILNASGGMEKDKPESYAMELNCTAQVETVNSLLPLMPAGAQLVFVTSHWAHFYGQHPVMPAYELVAKSKKAGEEALRARQGDLTARGIRLVVVSGDVIAGTITPKLLERSQPGFIEKRKQQTGALPTVSDFAHTIVNSVDDATLAPGSTLYVGPTE